MCPYCKGFGYVQVYNTIVMRVYCDCPAGDKRIEEIKSALREVGLDPHDPVYEWKRRSRYESKTYK